MTQRGNNCSSDSANSKYQVNILNIPAANHHNIHPTDLIMWKDVSRSTFVFGIGSFAIISSSTQIISISA
ncbi:hypothetical protein ACS0TY_029345 [Phlomoides rotata]